MSDTITNILTRLGIIGLAKGATAAAQATVTTVDADHNALDVSVRGTPALAADAATATLQGTGNASAATTATNTGTIAGAVSAPDATLPASATQIGGIASTAAPTAVTSGRGVRAWFSLIGAQMVGLLGANGSAIATGANPVPMQLSSGATLYTGATAALSLPVTFAPSLNASNTTLPINGVVIKSGTGTALWITITNTTGAGAYWQVFDLASGPPGAGARAIASAPAITANNGSRAGDLIGPTMGLGFANGLLLILSLSPTTYSAVGSNSCSYAIAYT